MQSFLSKIITNNQIDKALGIAALQIIENAVVDYLKSEMTEKDGKDLLKKIDFLSERAKKAFLELEKIMLEV
jgi:hypothetical protein